MLSAQDLLLFILNNAKTTYGVLETDIPGLYREVQLEVSKMVHSNRGDWVPSMPDVKSELKDLEKRGYVGDTKRKVGDDKYTFCKKTMDSGSSVAYEKEASLREMVGADGVDRIVGLIKERTAYEGKILILKD